MEKYCFRYPVSLLISLLCFLSTLQAQDNQACADTSYRMRFSSPGKDFSFYTHCNTADGGTVMIGRLVDTQNTALSNVIVMKLDATGGVVWKSIFQNLKSNGTYFSRIIEQSNGEIAAYGYTTSFNTTNTREIILLKLQSNGTLAWARQYGLTNHFDQKDLLHPFFLTEGQNNDLLLTIGGEHYDGITDSVYSVMARLDNEGNIVWSKALTNDSLTWWMKPSGIYVSGNEVAVLGHVDNVAAPCDFGLLSVYALKMNYGNGQPLLSKSYCYAPALSNSVQAGGAEERDWFNSVRLEDGRFALFGLMSAITTERHAYKLVFDSQLNLVQSQEYNIPNSQSNLLNRFTLLPDGTSHFYYLGGISRTLYWASLDGNNQVIRQRKIAFDQNGNTTGGFLNFGYRNSSTYNFSTNYHLNGRRYSLFTQVQRNDRAIDSCLGTDTSFVGTNPLAYSATSWTWQAVVDNPLVAKPLSLATGDFAVETENLCTQISRCDSLSILGPDTLCVDSGFITFTGAKNAECRKRVLWDLDKAWVDSSYQPDDSTLLVRFKPPAQEGQTLTLYASAAGCTIARDTTQLVLLPGVKPLPPDTVVCGPVSLRLSPGRWGRAYRWQDDSADSVFMATAPGVYWVEVQTSCGTFFSDTITITRPHLSLGADQETCNRDTVTLHATPGLVNYRWWPWQNITAVSDSVLRAYPADTTQYIVSAQTASGCIVSDTVTINVRHAPPVSLGRDTTFCEGAFLTLQAPASFASYQWSTGSTASSIIASERGTYWVKATGGNGCSSTDSITIFSLHPKPVVTIAPKGTVCIGQTDTLKLRNSYALYEWNNATANSFLPVTTPGTYWVRVMDHNGCTGSDTAVITNMASPPKSFLPPDTIVCSGTQVELKPTQNFRHYQWTSGAGSPSLDVLNAGLYVLQVSDFNNCIGTDSIFVIPKNCPNQIRFPSAFTPNADGRNDQFKPFVQGRLLYYQLTLYNRWGQVVFRSSDDRQGWDGRLNHLLQEPDSFVWLCHFQFTGEEKKQQKGTLTLIK